jgi:hypothetical protein
VFRYFAVIAGLNVPTTVTGDGGMDVDVLRNKAEEYLEKARAISDRQRARLLLVQAHNYLKCAEETEAQQLSARISAPTPRDRRLIPLPDFELPS